MIISTDEPISKKQIQPASVDCRLGDRVYRMSTAMFPKPGERISEMIEKYSIYDFDLQEGSVLEPGACYIIPLKESLNLSRHISAVFSPKSSIGRVDVFVRVLVDGIPSYDVAPYGYKGRSYLEITPMSFMVGVMPGLEMVQMRLRTANFFLSNADLEIINSKQGLVYSPTGETITPEIKNDSLYFHVDLDREIIGFEAKSNPFQKLDLFRVDNYNPSDFWIPVNRPKNGELVIVPGRFYLLATKERVLIPPSCAAEMIAYDPSSGEFRTHYAGFFDNGFGGERGTHAVLEVRGTSLPFRIYDGQPICRMVFEKTLNIPEKLYGRDLGSNYSSPEPCLSKIFKDKEWSRFKTRAM